MFARNFVLGIFFVGAAANLWWMILFFGSVSLILQRSYFVLLTGVVFDLWFGPPALFVGFYTLTFVVVTIVAEQIKKRLFWGV
ncbi:hypothetical protein COB52_02365 [Candidatus Kaiserbacteria bacterium]|nr:MAG: hypothetical protein COB52_02365 [Candidatus Kaiserbacteria bacterium]